MQSVLAKASKAEIKTDPYPHIVIENALDEDVYERLSAEFPSRDFYVAEEEQLKNNKYIETGPNCLASPDVSPLWKDFIRHHMSEDYYREVVALFGEVLRECFPNVEQTLGKPFDALSVGPRAKEYLIPSMSHPYDVMLDCQPQLDFTFTARKFRGPHVDSANEIYAGLLYMREPEDESTGGAIAVWRAKDEATAFPAPRTIRYDSDVRGMRRESLDLVYEVPYRANTLVMFINTWRSLHCAQTRSPSLLPRRAVNIIGEICRFPESGLFHTDRPEHLKKTKPTPSFLRRTLSHLRGH